jgi:hypothetical protein
MISIEMTDTFGCEANYSWVIRKDDNESKTIRQAITRFKKDHGIKRTHKIACDSGDFRRVNLNGMNVCIMAQINY